MSKKAYIAIGSNLGDRVAHLKHAVSRLQAAPGVAVQTVSPVYESAAHTLDPEEDQPPFLNAVVEVLTNRGSSELLALLHAVERERGRDRSGAAEWAPRTLDMDLLIFADERRSEPRLTIPHPRLGDRRFVLQPWADIAPQVHVPPPFDASVRELLAECGDENELRRTPYVLDAPRPNHRIDDE